MGEVDKVFTQQLKDGEAPVPAPLKDAAGKSDELKLMQQSELNSKRQKEQPAPKPVQPQPRKPVQKKPSKENEESN